MSSFEARDATPLYEQIWSADRSVGVLVLVHGYGEHIGRYDRTARELAQAGWTVHGADLRGHGQSGGARGFVRGLGEYLDDLSLLVERARAAAPKGVPLMLLSHSFGAVVAAEYLLRQPAAPSAGVGVTVDGWVVSSPFYRLAVAVPAIKLLAGRAASRIYPGLTMPMGLKGTDVSRDPKVIAEYESDPLMNKVATVRWFTETEHAQRDLTARAGEIRVPSLFLVGGADRVADARAAEEVFARLGSADKTLKLYPGQFHEVFNEPDADRARTVADLLGWLAPRSSSRQIQ
jgi:alpha-beta hydrolase superfamily lysophospholipase